MINPYNLGGSWLRGNIHTHTTASDGESEPQDVVDWYAQNGYDFLIITDHNLALNIDDLDPRGMLLIPGEELTAPCSHVLGLGLTETLPRGETTQEQIDLVNAAGGLAVVCHPNWMGLSADDLTPLHGHLGIEVFNRVCVRLNDRGDSVRWWDSLLAAGRRCWALSVDDCHDLNIDAGYGWLMVQALEHTWTAIRESLRAGSFIASTGARIERIDVDGSRLSITAPGAAVRYINSGGRALHEAPADRESPETSFSLPADEPFVRVEVTDRNGKRAWTQPFWALAAS